MMKRLNTVKIFKILLDITWFGVLVLAFSWVVMNIISVAFRGVVEVGALFSFKIELIKANPFQFSEKFDFSVIEPSTIKLILNTFKVSQLVEPFILLQIISFLIGISIFLYQIKLLRDFVKNIIDKKIFVAENVTMLNRIAYLELIVIPLTFIYYLLMHFIFKNGQVVNSDFKLVVNYESCFNGLIHALEYLLFASVFAFGFKLKQENDLTI